MNSNDVIFTEYSFRRHAKIAAINPAPDRGGRAIVIDCYPCLVAVRVPHFYPLIGIDDAGDEALPRWGHPQICAAMDIADTSRNCVSPSTLSRKILRQPQHGSRRGDVPRLADAKRDYGIDLTL